MTSSDFRSRARDALRGNWFVAVIAGFIASLLGAIDSGGVSLDINLSDSVIDTDFQNMMGELGITEETLAIILMILIPIMVIGLIYSIVMFVIGSGICVGYAQFNLDLVDGIKPSISTLFSRFGQWKTALVARLLVAVRVLIGTMLFIIPGIIAAYNYQVVDLVMAENPYMTAREAMEESKRLMKGNRWRFFCLGFSFFGWSMLCALTLGIAAFWVLPYTQAARTAFYREIKREAYGMV